MIRRKQTPIEADHQNEPKGFDAFDLRLGDVMRGERATLGKSLLDVQRELKIKANYIAAIENANPAAFETPGFIAGYVRSYARYLGLDPEWAFKTFCAESNFATTHGMAATSKPARPAPVASDSKRDPLSDPNATFVPRTEALLSRIEPGALGSVAVLVALIGALGFGGWSVFQEIQKVQLAPVEQSPGVYAEIDPLASTGAATPVLAGGPDVVASSDGFGRLYRPEPLEVPEMIARDAPIATIEPGTLGALADAGISPDLPATGGTAQPSTLVAGSAVANAVQMALNGQSGEAGAAGQVRVLAENAPEVVLFAMQPAWVRVTASDGSVLLEKIMDSGERFVLPATEEPPLLRTGYAGAIYFAVNGEAYGPAGEGGSVVSKVALSADALKGNYQVADLTQNPALASTVAEVIAPLTEPMPKIGE